MATIEYRGHFQVPHKHVFSSQLIKKGKEMLIVIIRLPSKHWEKCKRLSEACYT